MLSVAVIFSFMPLFTVQADAFSTGAKTFVKTRTVTIKPGKTYKTPVFKLSKKMALQVPVHITLAKKNLSDSDYNFKLSYKLSLKTSKGKTKDYYAVKKMGMYDVYSDNMVYDNWIYFFNKKVSKPGFAKGKYYFVFKNNSKKAIKVKYSVKGYTKFATEARFSTEEKIDSDTISQYVGRVGPGLPALKSVKSSNEDVEIDWAMTSDGKLYIFPYVEDYYKDYQTTVTVTLLTNKKYQSQFTIIGATDDE